MPKAYWVSAYRAVKDADKLAAYAKLAGPALTAGGGRFLARGEPAKVYEHGLKQRTVLIEFPTMRAAFDWYRGDEYTEARKLRAGAARARMYVVAGIASHA